MCQSLAEAVTKALDGMDYSEGALYFKGTKDNSNWNSLEKLFNHGGHSFYK